VIRRDLGSAKLGSLVVLGAGVLGFGAMLVTLSADPKLGLIASLGFAVALALFALLAWGAVLLLRRLVLVNVKGAGAPRWLLLATRQLAARPLLAVVQVAALAVGLLALALLVLLRTDLIDSWRQATPANAPNRFIINIQPEQGEPLRAALEAAGVRGYDWYPMIRGRLVGINGQPVRPGQFAQERAQRLAEREFNLSHAAELPQHNQVVCGRWQSDEADGLSLEEGLAEQLGLKLGDRLRFDVAGIPVEARITSLRKVDWSSMRANFFVIFPRKAMGEELPGSYITAYRAPAAEAGAALDRQLSHDFPNITAVDVSAQLNQMQAVLGQVINAVQFLFMFTLATGLVVLLAAVSSTRELRTREFALMRALGASSALLRQVQRAELLGLGALAGLLAGGVALMLGQLLARYVFEFDWRASPWVPLASMVCGALLAQLAGWWSLRNVLLQPVVTTLRQADTQ
jgi:putative ABC transport system permease protein